MPYKGHVEKGVIVLDDPVVLEDGTSVAIEVTGRPADSAQSSPKLRHARYESLIGSLEDMPGDWAEGHDMYLRGQHGL